MPHNHLLYVSSLINEYGHDLPDILRSSTRNNQAQGINSILLCRNGNLLQLIEGPSAAVRATQVRIANDTRHFGMNVLLNEPVATLELTGTSSGLTTMDANLVNLHCPGLDIFKPKRAEIDKRVQPGVARELLQQFVENYF